MYKLILALACGAVMAGCAVQKKEEKPQVYHLSFSDAAKVATEKCQTITEKEVANLFDRWNASLKFRSPNKMMVNYDVNSIFMPEFSNKVRITSEDKKAYFHDFMQKKPSAVIDSRNIQIHCNTAIDSGLYTFSYGKKAETIKARYTFVYKWNGQKWVISTHHSSVMPQGSDVLGVPVLKKK